MSVTFGGRTSSHHGKSTAFSPIPNITFDAIVDLSSLRLTGQSVAPVHHEKHDHAKPHLPEDAGARTMEKKLVPDQRVFVKKERQGFGGGFKILEEYRRKQLSRKSKSRKADDDDSIDNKD